MKLTQSDYGEKETGQRDALNKKERKERKKASKKNRKRTHNSLKPGGLVVCLTARQGDD